MAELARSRGYRVMSPDYQGLDTFSGRVEKLRQELPTRAEALVLVGSSMGAYVAAAVSAEAQPVGLFLLAPAIYMPGHENDHLAPQADHCLVVHGWHDEVVPVDHAIRWCRRHSLPLLLLDGDHRLMSVLDQICEQFGRMLDDLAH